MSLPANITPVMVTGTSLTRPDGGNWNGTVIFAPSSLLVDSTAGALLGGTATSQVTDGVLVPVNVVPTDCPSVTPSPFTYTITVRLVCPDGAQEPDLVFPGVAIPASASPASLLALLP